ncbi:MAG: hypothetical protein JWR38_1955 [Mucilaginibacter sp.]|nr:hypothetical protein [Mucilaginibacter sp.]
MIKRDPANSPDSKYVYFNIPFQPVDKFLNLYFPDRPSLSEMGDDNNAEEQTCNYIFNDEIIGFPIRKNHCYNTRVFMDKLRDLYLLDDTIILSGENCDEYIVLVFYILAYKTNFKNLYPTQIKYNNDINKILDTVLYIKRVEANSNNNINIQIKTSAATLTGNDGITIDLPINLSILKNVVVAISENTPFFKFITTFDKLFDSKTTIQEIITIRNTLEVKVEDYSKFIELRSITMLVNYLRFTNSKKEKKKITNDEIRFIIKTFRIVGLSALSPYETKSINSFRIAYERALGHLE